MISFTRGNEMSSRRASSVWVIPIGSRNSRKRTSPGWTGRFLPTRAITDFGPLFFITLAIILPHLEVPSVSPRRRSDIARNRRHLRGHGCKLGARATRARRRLRLVYREWADPRDGTVWLVQVFYATSEDHFGRPRAMPRMITFRLPVDIDRPALEVHSAPMEGGDQLHDLSDDSLARQL